MTTLLNNFEGGTSAATISTSNTAGSGNASFDAVTIQSTGTAVFGTTAAHGTLGAAITNAAGNAAWVQWESSLTSTGIGGTLYLREALRVASLPASEVAIMRGMTAGGGAQRWRICVTTAGKVTVRTQGSTNAVVGTSSMSLSTGTWYRIEAAMAAPNSTTCTAEVRIYVGDATSPAETIGPLTGLDFAGPVYQVRFGHCAAASSVTALLVDDVGVSDVAWLGPAVVVPLVKSVWVGAVTDGAATVAYNTTGVTSAQVVVSTTSDLATSPITSSSVTVDSNGNAKCSVSGLSADTVYYYGIKADGVLLSGQGRGSFRTDPTAGMPVSFSVAFGSCMQTNSNTAALAAIVGRSGPYGAARRMIHEGDLHYRDFGSGNTSADVVAQYKSSLAVSNLAALTSSLPMTYSWDNHDWGGPDSSSGTPRAADLKAAYRSFVPHYPLADDAQTSPTGAIYQSWVIGRVRFIDLDTRSERNPRTDTDGAGKRMLSDQQEQWLYSELLQPEPVKVICSGIYWRFDSVNGDRWGSYYTQWTRIKNWFAAHPAVQAYVICGDRHALAADNGTSTNCYLPQAVGAPLDQGCAASSEAWSEGYYITGDGINMKAYGWLDITDAGSSITVDFSGSTSDNTQRVSMSTTFAVSGTTGQWGVPL